jgi:hydroxymethylglutaryl-CoA reductase (NADPH)
MVGFVGIPVGIAGPLVVDGRECLIPLATTEGALVASTNRGCKAASVSGGVATVLTGKGMTRGPFIRLPGLARASQVKDWIDASFSAVSAVFNATSSHIRLVSVRTTLAGRYLFVRFKADTGEAMGMNMLSKASEAALKLIQEKACPDAEMVCLSGNYCTDKKAGAAVNWVDGRGYSVVAEALIPAAILRDVLKVDSARGLAELAQAKNLVGSTMAGVSAGGQNCHAANLVAAVFLACGQDMAQVVESSACLTLCEACEGGSLRISVTMPTIEVGVIGGGTRLPAQTACIQGLVGCAPEGTRAEALARVVAATVLAGELSLLAALYTGSLVSSHLAYNRRPT